MLPGHSSNILFNFKLRTFRNLLQQDIKLHKTLSRLVFACVCQITLQTLLAMVQVAQEIAQQASSDLIFIIMGVGQAQRM